MSISAVVVSHGHAAELRDLLPALRPQVDELVVVANRPGSVGEAPGVRVLENPHPLGFAANANRGIAATSGEFVVIVNPDAVPEPDVVATLHAFAVARPRCGVVGPRMLFADGSWQPTRRRFPTVVGTLVRRTPLRALFRPFERQRAHYMLDERPTEPVQADWMIGAFLLLRRAMLDELGGFDAHFRLYGEDIDLCYRAARAGWERWYVPAAVVHHAYDRASDRRLLTRRTLWHWRGILRFVRKHPERLRSVR
ncbi:MAG: glycosyltransferase family 2 protein [Gaiellaceae bacterium]